MMSLGISLVAVEGTAGDIKGTFGDRAAAVAIGAASRRTELPRVGPPVEGQGRRAVHRGRRYHRRGDRVAGAAVRAGPSRTCARRQAWVTPVASASPGRAPAATAGLERHKGCVPITDAGTGAPPRRGNRARHVGAGRSARSSRPSMPVS